jgi:ppGpp synthetase/RelA/SpoT-type nucleotidyltranferase
MRFARLKYSKEEVNKAGELLISPPENLSYDDLVKAYTVINNWRTSHSFPLRTIRYGIYHKAKKIDSKSVTVQRLKRIYSIDLKLRRFPKLKLSDIQDIGGCRSVVSTVSEIQKLVDAYKSSEIRHELDDSDDYITNPKKSGYRSHHLIYRYQSDRNETYNGLKIEIQIRSTLQHAWATAVETVGGFIGQALKSNQGKDEGKDWLRFFTLMGTAIASIENCPPCPKTPATGAELKKELQHYAKKLDVENRLNAYGVTITSTKTARAKSARFFLLLLDTKTKQIEIKGFRQDELKKAAEEYTKIETGYPQKAGKDVVLVSGDSLKDIERAYPNYYLDTALFLNVLKKSIQS